MGGVKNLYIGLAFTTALFQVVLLSAPRADNAADPALEQIKNLALASPPGSAADALLRLAMISRSESVQWRRSLIERAYEIAGMVSVENAYEPVPIGFTDSVPATLSISSELLKVDRLSLQARAAEMMLAIDKGRALEMFDNLQLPALPRLSCQSLSVPDVSSYYEAMRTISDQCFARTSTGREKKRAFIAARITGINSPVQVFPIVRLLTNIEIQSQGREALVSVLASAVAHLDSDDRAFTSAFLREEAAQSLRALVVKCRNEGTDPTALLSSVRAFYARQLGGVRCSDTATNTVLRDRFRRGVQLFNQLAKGYSVGVPPIPNRIEPEKLESAATARDLWKGSSQHATFIKEMNALSQDSSPNGSEHTDRLLQLVRSVSDWSQPDDLDSVEFFILKKQLFNQLLQLSGGGEGFQAALDATVRFLEANATEEAAQPALWIRSVTDVLAYSKSLGAPAQEAARREFERSSDPSLNLYANLDELISDLGRRSSRK